MTLLPYEVPDDDPRMILEVQTDTSNGSRAPENPCMQIFRRGVIGDPMRSPTTTPG